MANQARKGTTRQSPRAPRGRARRRAEYIALAAHAACGPRKRRRRRGLWSALGSLLGLALSLLIAG